MMPVGSAWKADMQLRPQDISIAVTVYRRLDYLESALRSAIEQTVPVRVLLYDDGCEDAAQLARILHPFGDRVEYVRNERTLGLFGNMNAVLRHSPTPWVSILHDDDRVAPDFIERILEIAPEVEDCSLFFGGTVYLSPSGQPFHAAGLPKGVRWRRVTAEDFALRTWFAFPGQLMHAPTAGGVGGFGGVEHAVEGVDEPLDPRLQLLGVVAARERGRRVGLGADLFLEGGHARGERGVLGPQPLHFVGGGLHAVAELREGAELGSRRGLGTGVVGALGLHAARGKVGGI